MTERDSKHKYWNEYWAISNYGEAVRHIWSDDVFDNATLENNALFITREEAEFEAERLKVLRELEKMGGPFMFTFNNWCVYLNFQNNIDYFCEFEDRSIYGNYYFRSKDEAVKAVEKIGEDRIKRYLFRVGE